MHATVRCLGGGCFLLPPYVSSGEQTLLAMLAQQTPLPAELRILT